MDALDPRILLYGEGWDMGTGLAPEDKAKEDNAAGTRIGCFFVLGALKGLRFMVSIKRGFVSRKSTGEISLRAALGECGAQPSISSPNQVLNYVELTIIIIFMTCFRPFIRMKKWHRLGQRSELATAMNL